MASVMAIKRDVFGSCVGEIDVGVGNENRSDWLCYGWNFLGFILVGKASQHLRWK